MVGFFQVCVNHRLFNMGIARVHLPVRSVCTWNTFHQSQRSCCKMDTGRQKHSANNTSVHRVPGMSKNTLFLCNQSVIVLVPNGMRHSRQYSTTNVPEESTHLPSVVADLFFPEFPTVQGAESFIAGIHAVTGLPWWTTIIASAFLLRTLLPLPLSIYSMHNSVRLQRLQPEIKAIAKGLKKEVSVAMHQFGWDQKKVKTEYIKNMKRHLRNLYIRDNCHPMKDAASFWIRLPIWVSASYALRNMSVRASNPQLDNHETCQSMTAEGLAWFTDLTLVDSTFILPVMMGAVTLLNVEIGRRYVTEITTYRRYLTYGLRTLSLVFIPISACLPSGLVLYWISSGLFSAAQTMLVDRSKTFQNLIGIKAPSDTDQQPPKD